MWVKDRFETLRESFTSYVRALLVLDPRDQYRNGCIPTSLSRL